MSRKHHDAILTVQLSSLSSTIIRQLATARGISETDALTLLIDERVQSLTPTADETIHPPTLKSTTSVAFHEMLRSMAKQGAALPRDSYSRAAMYED